MDALDQVIDEAVEAHPLPSASAPVLIAEAQAELGAGDSAAPGTAHGDAQPAGPAGWDPRFHVSPPTATLRGGWKLKAGIRASDVQRQLDAARAAGGEEIPPDASSAADEHADLFFGLCQIALGPAWSPSDEERIEVKRQLKRVYDRYGCKDLPPGLALTVAVGFYAVPRAMQPATRQRVSAAVSRVRSFFGADVSPASPPVIEERLRDAA